MAELLLVSALTTRTSICIAYFPPYLSSSTNRTLLPSLIHASTFFRFCTQYSPAKLCFIAVIPATLVPSVTVVQESGCYHVICFILHTFTAASPKSLVTAVVECLLGSVACPWWAPKYTSITYITFVLLLISWKMQWSYLLHSMYLLHNCLSLHLCLYQEEKSTWALRFWTESAWREVWGV